MLAETIQGWYAEAEAKGKAIGEAKGKAIGEAKGEARGEIKGKAKSLIFLLETKFSTLSQEQLDCIFAMEDKQIEEAMSYIFAAPSLEDMFRFIKSLL